MHLEPETWPLQNKTLEIDSNSAFITRTLAYIQQESGDRRDQCTNNLPSLQQESGDRQYIRSCLQEFGLYTTNIWGKVQPKNL